MKHVGPRNAGLKRQVFEAFQLRIADDRLGRRITISATVSEAVADGWRPRPYGPPPPC